MSKGGLLLLSTLVFSTSAFAAPGRVIVRDHRDHGYHRGHYGRVYHYPRYQNCRNLSRLNPKAAKEALLKSGAIEKLTLGIEQMHGVKCATRRVMARATCRSPKLQLAVSAVCTAAAGTVLAMDDVAEADADDVAEADELVADANADEALPPAKAPTKPMLPKKKAALFVKAAIQTADAKNFALKAYKVVLFGARN